MRATYLTTPATYADGYADSEIATVTHRFDVLAAIDSWTDAQSDHGHTSYYGAAVVRGFRAYWLGVLRRQRAEGWGFHTFHQEDQ